VSVQIVPTLSPRSLQAPRPRPLLIRPGARFDCFGDGLCCTDIHALGPVTRAEKREVDLLAPGSLVRHKDLNAPVFRTASDGGCVNLSRRGCELHAQHGPEAKPKGCSRFPFGLVSTPEGGRITTEHRCPCRTLGARPTLQPEAVLPSLLDSAGRLFANGNVGPRIPITRTSRVAFARFRLLEQDTISRLLALEEPSRVFAVKPFCRLDGLRWIDVARRCREERDGTSYGEALVWFSNAITAARTGERMAQAERPWSLAFDRAEARSPNKESADAVLADYIADVVWSLDWVFSMGTFEAGARELVTVHAIAREIAQALIRKRVRADRAAAEAVMIVELARQSGMWEEVQEAMR
jgi:hypothetical protein